MLMVEVEVGEKLWFVKFVASKVNALVSEVGRVAAKTGSLTYDSAFPREEGREE